MIWIISLPILTTSPVLYQENKKKTVCISISISYLFVDQTIVGPQKEISSTHTKPSTNNNNSS